MSYPDHVDDDELILVHVPSGERWQAPGPRLTSGNFELRKQINETGKSVMRCKPGQVEEGAGRLLSKVRSTSASWVACCSVAELRDLGFEVVATPLKGFEEHAEIRSDDRSLDRHADRKRLANIFRILERTE